VSPTLHTKDQDTFDFLLAFFKTESGGGILLMISALLAIILANSPFLPWYQVLLDTPVEIRIGALHIAKPLLLWINDGLMAIFFFLVGLELKRELLEGELSQLSSIVLPAIGAVGGMIVPAAIYWWFNGHDSQLLSGWAIPAATDIAFALGILSLLGSRVPTSLKIFLTSLAIFDDIGAVVIIALFYTSKLSIGALIIVSLCLPILAVLNKRNVISFTPYILIGVVMWVAMLKSGVHATLAGVLLAAFIPMRDKNDNNYSPVKELEHDLHGMVAYAVLPIFAFANAGISLSGVGIEQLMHSVPMGIAGGLFIGKQVGIFVFCGLAIKLGISQMPKGMSWTSLYGVAALCGVGFTMSLFIGSLAFEETGVDIIFDERLGIIIGSLASGLLGYAILNKSLAKVAQ